MIRFASICVALFAFAMIAVGFHIIDISETRIIYATSIDHIHWAVGSILLLSSLLFGMFSVQLWCHK
jgi:TRAP-type C4-dicarboxylate transport system permease small subunit